MSSEPGPRADKKVFRRRLAESIVDKLVLGILLAAFTFAIDRRMEVFRKNQTLTTEVAKHQFESLGKVAEAMAAAEHAFRALDDKLDELEDAADRGGSEEEERRLGREVRVKRAEAHRAVANVGDVLRRERFWLGDESIASVRTHMAALVWDLRVAVAPTKADLDYIEGTRPHVSDVSEDDRIGKPRTRVVRR